MKEHDKIATRLGVILNKLNSGERLCVDELADEFNVNKRTIQRDLNDRFSYLPLQKENGCYYLEAYCLGKLNFEDIKNFAMISGIKDLYPELNDSFIVDLLNSKINQAYMIKSYEYEKMGSKSEIFELLNIAIVKQQVITLTYKDKERKLNPYKLINTNGIWYLSADEDAQLKTFTISKISNLSITLEPFKANKEFQEKIAKNQDRWFSSNSIEVILEIDKEVKEYFLRRNLLPHQTVLENKENLIISTTVSYEDEILSSVKYWIPHVKIIKPPHLQEKLTNILKKYIQS